MIYTYIYTVIIGKDIPSLGYTYKGTLSIGTAWGEPFADLKKEATEDAIEDASRRLKIDKNCLQVVSLKLKP